MKPAAALAVGLSVFADRALSHYIFERFTYGGEEYPVYQYIRPNTNYNSPITDLTSDDLRCNQGGETGTGTETIAVTAGAQFTFTTDVAVYHDGPLSIYMAKAPTTAEAFDGSGQVWFKILDIGPTFNTDGTSTWDLEQSYTYSIPSALPNGEYLLRIQQLAIHNPWPAGTPQFYLECAQISVTGGGSGTPGPLVEIPGYIDGTEPGYTVNIYSDFSNYTVPGPAVWTGQNGAGGASSVVSVAAPAPTSVVVATTTAVAKTTVVASPKPTAASSGSVAEYGQCGGTGWSGATACVSGLVCTVLSDYYSQCLSG